MNVAVLFDTEQKLHREGNILAGKELFQYSFRQCYLNPEIDHVITVGLDEDAVFAYADNLKKELLLEKPVSILSDKSAWREKDGAELYVFHDIRYPLVTGEMLNRVMQKAALYGSCITAEMSPEENLARNDGKGNASWEALDTKQICMMKYPAAVRNDSAVFKEWNRILQIEDWLTVLGKQQPYLCEGGKHYRKVCTKEAAELAEAMLSIKEK